MYLGMRCPPGFRLNTGITGVEDRVAENILDTCCLAACVGVIRQPSPDLAVGGWLAENSL